jgi:hypothetical protein
MLSAAAYVAFSTGANSRPDDADRCPRTDGLVGCASTAGTPSNGLLTDAI